MTTATLGPVLRRLRGLAASAAAGELTDRQLLERFAARREEEAFAVLVRRHGPLVLGVCRRLLRQEQDAEDAFQATFLVLARKAGAVSWHESVGGWLYQVAGRVAGKARAASDRRRACEREVAAVSSRSTEDAPARCELRLLLDEEVRRLPEKYRAPVVLCYLEEKSHAEAARLLGWPVGTVKGRLARARRRLRARLARHGLAQAAVAVAPLLGSELASAAVPAALASAAVRAAPPFAAGVTATIAARAVVLAEAVAAGKRRLLALLVALVVLGVGTGLLSAAARQDRNTAVVAAADEPAPPAEARAPDRPRSPLQGWRERLAARAGGTARSEAAVAAGLDWLAHHQADDGHWSLERFPGPGPCDCTGAGSTRNDTAATAFGLLPFLGAGFSHRDGGRAGHARTVERGLGFLVQRQKPDGDFGDGMYAQGLATLALCEAYGLTADPALKGPAQRAVDYLVAAQDPRGGGWRYAPRQDSDTSVTGWQVQALRRAELAGLRVPRETLDRVPGWLNACESSDGGYGYTGSSPTPSMTAVGLLCRQLLGWGKRPPTLRRGLAHLDRRGPGAVGTLYYAYYATQVLHNLDGPRWEKWNPAMRDGLIAAQDRGNDPQHPHQMGSWSPDGDSFGKVGGRLMVTALALRILEVYYQADLPLAARPPRPLAADALPRLWDDLAGDDVPRAREAVWALVGAPAEAVPFLKEHVRPAALAVDRRRLEEAARELDDDRFAVRRQAAADLEKAGEAAEPVLRRLLEGQPSVEARRRAEDLLQALDEAAYTADWRRLRQALEVLELTGTPEARQVLEAAARGTPEARLTRAAKAALARLGRQPDGKP
jgi:RNA polymerase sigma factor (sigma-70 family)